MIKTYSYKTTNYFVKRIPQFHGLCGCKIYKTKINLKISNWLVKFLLREPVYEAEWLVASNIEKQGYTCVDETTYQKVKCLEVSLIQAWCGLESISECKDEFKRSDEL